MHGKTVAITGATSGIGEVAALELAKMGARVVFTARDATKGADTLARLRAVNPSASPALITGDLSLIAGMKSVAAGIAAEAPSIDVLINNAGAYFAKREITADGLEKTFALNHMAYFVVTEVLRPHLAADARIVSTASVAHTFGKLDFDDLQSAKAYRRAGMEAYGTSKLLNILWTRELARRLSGTGVTANCVHPGGVNTGFGDNNSGLLGTLFKIGKRVMLTPEQGADTLIYLASSPDAAGQTGGYWTKRKRVEPSAAARDAAAAKRLWDESARIAALPESLS
jgi:NAD(P)-dependent dehydrogenase (short-subunit alcohol dehydrogenase family)